MSLNVVASRALRATPSLILCALFCSACGPEEYRDRSSQDDPPVVVIEGDMGGEDLSPPASDDARCKGEACSEHGSCQIVAEQPLCQCESGYQSRGLSCEVLPVGAPSVVSVSSDVIQLTEGATQTLVVEARFEGSAKAILRYPAGDGEPAEDLFPFEEVSAGRFELTLSWAQINEFFEGIEFRRPFVERLEIHVEDAQGRSVDRPVGFILHCNDKGGSACDGACTDLSTDVRNCGECGAITPSGASCEEGIRVCGQSGLVACDQGCVPRDEENCGTCGNACERGMSCRGELNGFCHAMENLTGLSATSAMAADFLSYLYFIEFDRQLPEGVKFLQYSNHTGDFTALTPPSLPANRAPDEWHSAPNLIYNVTAETLTLTYAVTLTDDTVALYAQQATFSDATWKWEAPERLSTTQHAPSKAPEIKAHADGEGALWIAHRSTQGVELFSRESTMSPWTHETTYTHTGSTEELKNIAFHHDAVRNTSHLVYLAGDVIWAAERTGEEAWQASPITQITTRFLNHVISDIKSDNDGILYAIHQEGDQLRELIKIPGYPWQEGDYITPTTPPGSDIKHEPSPRTFEVDEHGNRWVFINLSTGSYGSGGVLVGAQYLFMARAGQLTWKEGLLHSARNTIYRFHNMTRVPYSSDLIHMAEQQIDGESKVLFYRSSFGFSPRYD